MFHHEGAIRTIHAANGDDLVFIAVHNFHPGPLRQAFHHSNAGDVRIIVQAKFYLAIDGFFQMRLAHLALILQSCFQTLDTRILIRLYPRQQGTNFQFNRFFHVLPSAGDG